MAAARARGEFRARPSAEAPRHRSSVAAIGVHTCTSGPRVRNPASARRRAPVPPVGAAASVGAFIIIMLIIYAARVSAVPESVRRVRVEVHDRPYQRARRTCALPVPRSGILRHSPAYSIVYHDLCISERDCSLGFPHPSASWQPTRDVFLQLIPGVTDVGLLPYGSCSFSIGLCARLLKFRAEN